MNMSSSVVASGSRSPLGSPAASLFTLVVVNVGSPSSSFVPVNFVDRVGVDGKVLTYSSCFKAPDLLQIDREYGFPRSSLLVVLGPADRACWPPSGFVTIYEDSLKGGLRVPYPTIYTELQHQLGISIAQITPNAIRQIIAWPLWLVV